MPKHANPICQQFVGCMSTVSTWCKVYHTSGNGRRCHCHQRQPRYTGQPNVYMMLFYAATFGSNVGPLCGMHPTWTLYVVCRLRYEPGTFVAHHAGLGTSQERYERIADELQDPAVSGAPWLQLLCFTLCRHSLLRSVQNLPCCFCDTLKTCRHRPCTVVHSLKCCGSQLRACKSLCVGCLSVAVRARLIAGCVSCRHLGQSSCRMVLLQKTRRANSAQKHFRYKSHLNA